MSTWPARHGKRESTLQKRAIVLLISLTPQAWRRSQTPCPGKRTIGRLSRVCERWIYTTCLCFALDLEEQKRSRFHYQYSNYQVEYSRNLLFEIGGQMDQVFQALIDCSRVLLDLKTVRTILGYQRRPRYHKRKKKSAEWEVAVEKPVYDLTIFKLHCSRLTLKIYTKGERVLRIEVVVHNTQELRYGRSLEKFPDIVRESERILERFIKLPRSMFHR